MTRKAYLRATGSIFFLIAFLHLLRLVFAWEAEVGGWVVPEWLSVIAVIVTGYLAYKGFTLSGR